MWWRVLVCGCVLYAWGKSLQARTQSIEAMAAVEAWSYEVEAGTEGAGEALRASLQALKSTL